MSLSDWWSDQETIVKVLIILAVLFVLGPLLMTALTVGGAVIGTFMLDMGDSSTMASAPEASFTASHDASTNTATLTHNGGEPVQQENLRVTVNGESVPTEWSTGTGTVQAGATVDISDVEPGDTVTLHWESESGETRILGQFTF